MTQTTIYLSVTRDDKSLVFEGSLDLFNELFITIANAAKGTPIQTTTEPVIQTGTVTVETTNKRKEADHATR